MQIRNPKSEFRNPKSEDYADEMPPELFALWDKDAVAWAAEQYHSSEFIILREKYIEIEMRMTKERPGPKRSALVTELFALRNGESMEGDWGVN